MNEEGPVHEFLEGCGVGFVLVFGICAALVYCFLFFMGAPGIHTRVTGDSILSLVLAAALGGLMVSLIVLLVRRAVRAFSEKRHYYVVGLVSFSLIPLLFFGVCTMSIGRRPVVARPPHGNPTTFGVDSHQNRK